ncbi:hypothetical protein ABTM81_19915, partial [Acinetobacter baumannii]
LWTHACAMLGLLEAAQVTGRSEFLDSAAAVGDLIIKSFDTDPCRLLQFGNHHGLSALVVIDPLARLTAATDEPRFAEFAARVFASA